MAAGKSFTMTDKRIEELKYLLGRQYSVRYVANKWNITPEALSAKMKELGLNARELKKDGINTMKADLIGTIEEIDEPKDKAKATLDFLKHYDTSDDVASKKSEVEVREVEKCYLPLKDEEN